MRHEVIKLTDAAIYPELIKLLESKGTKIGFMSSKLRNILHHDKLVWDKINGWCLLPVGNSELPTINDTQFLQKYREKAESFLDFAHGMMGINTEPEADKERELLEGFRDYLKTRGVWSWTVEIDNFLSSLRKPAFELITHDNVRVTDPEQMVWWISSSVSKGKASDMKNWGYRCWASESAALNHRLNNTPAIKLSDMDWNAGYYQIAVEKAHNLVNERINGKQPL